MKRLLAAAILAIASYSYGQTVISNVYVQSSTATTDTIVWTTDTSATSTDSSCTGTANLSPAMSGTTYFPMLTINSINGAFLAISVSGSLGTTSFPYTITCTYNCSSIVTPTVYVHVHHN